MIERKICPRCNTPCKLRAISTFDLNGVKYGAILVCPKCKSPYWDILRKRESR